MTKDSFSRADLRPHRGPVAWLLFLLALFPPVALLTYDWRAIKSLYIPAAASSNMVGALGDTFAHVGYTLLGLAVWIIPIYCIIGMLLFVLNNRRSWRLERHSLWHVLTLVTSACLLQVIGNHAPAVGNLIAKTNTPDAGGAVGYLIMTKCLSPLLSDFGSTVLMSVLLIISLIETIGLHTLKRFFTFLWKWSMPPHTDDADARTDDADAQYEAARQARIAAKESARLEKERIKAEKIAAKEAALQERERLKAERLASGRTRFWGRNDEPPIPVEQPPEPPPYQSSYRRQAIAPRDVPRSTARDPKPVEPKSDNGKQRYVLPSVSLLGPVKRSAADHAEPGDTGKMSKCLINTLKLFGVDAELDYTIRGPVVTKYALRLAPGIKYSAVTNLSDNLMGALHAMSLRIEAPIPGEECVGIEVPNTAPASISFREIFESAAWRNFKGELPLLFGKDAAGRELIADLASMPHMLVAGATGQGKSVCLNSLINGLLMTKTPDELKLIMVDPKSVEFTPYASIPHLIVPVITDNKKVVFSLHWAVAEMEKRLKMFARAKVRNIYDFNHRPQISQPDMFGSETETETDSDMPKTVPYIIIIIDEVADLMSTCAKDVVPDISRLTAKARAAGIHLILATQRPDAKVITGTIKANIPGRVAFKTSQAIDSRTILDEAGAENLIGKGDMLFRGKDGRLTRAQGAWISDAEIANVIRFIEQHSSVQFDERFTKKLDTIQEEEIDIYAEPGEKESATKAAAAEKREQVKADAAASDFKKAVECVINTRRASTSHFQRQLGWGYNHAAKILDMLEAKGIVSSQSGVGPRQIVMDQDQLLAIFNGDGANADEFDEPSTDTLQDTEPTEEET